MTGVRVGHAIAAERALLEALYREALAAVDPGPAVRRCLEAEAVSLGPRVRVFAVGKAAEAMAAAASSVLGGRVEAGLVVAPARAAEPLRGFDFLQADHPIPGRASAVAGRRSLAFVASTPPGVSLLGLLSGGTSALLFAQPPGVSALEVAELNRVLLASGLPVEDVNRVRRRVSSCGAGALARAAGALRPEVLVLSDVLGDRLDVIGSGPFWSGGETVVELMAWLRGQAVVRRMPPGIVRHLENLLQAEGHGERKRPETVAPHRIVASNRDALEAAATACEARGLRPIVVSRAMRGEASRVGKRIAALLQCALAPGSRRHCLLFGGETTVTLRGAGQGGRNQELALAAAQALAGVRGVSLLAAGTDGRDGPTDAAGAYADGGTRGRAATRGLDAGDCLLENDSNTFFEGEGGVFVTGPSGTNAMDLVLGLCRPPPGWV